jgi:hypothetical protein
MRKFNKVKTPKHTGKLILGFGVIALLYVLRGFITSTLKNVFGSIGTAEHKKPDHQRTGYNPNLKRVEDADAFQEAESLYSLMIGYGGDDEQIVDILFNSSDLPRLFDAFGVRDYDWTSDITGGTLGTNMQPLGVWLRSELNDYWDYDKHQFTNDESYFEVARLLTKKQGIKI